VVCCVMVRGMYPNSPHIESTLRSIRRYVKRAEELMLAAAKGEFPGESRMGSKDRRSIHSQDGLHTIFMRCPSSFDC